MLIDTAGYFSAVPVLAAHVDDGHWWVECPECPGWTAAAESWDELFRLVAEWHTGRHGWTMFQPFIVESVR